MIQDRIQEKVDEFTRQCNVLSKTCGSVIKYPRDFNLLFYCIASDVKPKLTKLIEKYNEISEMRPELYFPEMDLASAFMLLNKTWNDHIYFDKLYKFQMN